MKWLREHGLGIVLMILFLIFLSGQSLAGFRHYNEEQQVHMQATLSYGEYLQSGDFVEGVFENWESEFLQMAAFVILTVFLRHKGSAESKKLKGEEATDRKPQQSVSRQPPWPVRQGGWWIKLYEHSLSLVFVALFIGSFWLHAYGGARATTEDNLAHGEEAVTTTEYIKTSKFWYESLQNWQSEFLAVASIVVLSVYLREKGSHESKPVSSPNSQTGTE